MDMSRLESLYEMINSNDEDAKSLTLEILKELVKEDVRNIVLAGMLIIDTSDFIDYTALKQDEKDKNSELYEKLIYAFDKGNANVVQQFLLKQDPVEYQDYMILYLEFIKNRLEEKAKRVGYKIIR